MDLRNRRSGQRLVVEFLEGLADRDADLLRKDCLRAKIAFAIFPGNVGTLSCSLQSSA
jgi:hypothetical protein